ncbi:MAG: aminodeoxychorismate/anthranilate synthase component II [Chitinophagales bacterium]|nr:aminodeoxychorismate/anthranilate synthase component II [Chitinophagales bacterium]
MNALLLDCDDSYTLNIYDYLKQCGLVVDVINCRDIILDKILVYDTIVLSPGPNSPVDVPVLFGIIEKFAGYKPILGICLGHQAIGMYYGHTLVQSHNPIHGISVKISNRDDAIFHNIDTENLMVMRYNSLALQDKKESELHVIARDEAGEIMAVRHKRHNIYGIQFHPESVGTPQGLKLIENWKKQLHN